MGDGIFAGIIISFLFVVAMMSLSTLFVKFDEWDCERLNNVYSCVQDDTWHPVFEEGPEEELMP